MFWNVPEKIKGYFPFIKDLEYAGDYEEPSVTVYPSTADWGFSKRELLSYCDSLAPKLLKEWGLNDIEEWNTEDSPDKLHFELPSSDEEDITEKVARWMDTNNPGEFWWQLIFVIIE